MATIDRQVGADTDDAYSESQGVATGLASALANYNNALKAGNDKIGPFYYNVAGGCRFTGVTIPPGATFDVAYLTFTASGTEAGAVCNAKIAAEDAAAPGAFVESEDLASIIQTTAKVDWPSIGGWSINVEYNSPSIIGIIEELVASYDYSSGSSMLFLWYNDGSDQGVCRAAYAHYNTPSNAAKLHIEYSVGPTPGYYQLQYTSEPPTPNAWNQLKQETGTGDYKKLFYEGE